MLASLCNKILFSYCRTMESSDEDMDYDPDNEESDSHNNEKNSTEHEITRGITLMKKVIRARDKGVKYEVVQQFV